MKSRYGTVVVLLAGIALGALSDNMSHGQPPSAADAAPVAMSSGGSMNMSPTPMGDAQMMKAMHSLDTSMKAAHLNGDQDHDFMLMMIPHHQAAIDMAQVELRYGQHPQLKAVARNIIKSQTAEIAQMRQWLLKWYGSTKPD